MPHANEPKEQGWLRWIAESTAPVEMGGFHPNAVAAAKWALSEIAAERAHAEMLAEALGQAQYAIENWGEDSASEAIAIGLRAHAARREAEGRAMPQAGRKPFRDDGATTPEGSE